MKKEIWFIFDKPPANKKVSISKNNCKFYTGNRKHGNCISCYKNKFCPERIKQKKAVWICKRLSGRDDGKIWLRK